MYRIVDWEKHFENNRSRALKKLDWVPFPNKHDGDGYTQLVDHEDGISHFGVWCLIAQIASKCEPRGTLSRDGFKPHDAASISRITRIPATIIQAAIDRLINPVGWLEVLDDKQLESIRQAGAGITHDDASRACAEGNQIEGNEKKDRNGSHDAFAGLSIDVLKSTPRLMAWFKSQALRADPAVDQSQDSRDRVFAAAEQALEKGKTNKVGLFINIIKQGSAAKLNQDCEKRALARLAEFDKPRDPEGPALKEFRERVQLKKVPQT